MKTISVKVEEDLWRKTRQCALDGGVSLTEVVARLLRCYVDGKIVLKGALTEGAREDVGTSGVCGGLEGASIGTGASGTSVTGKAVAPPSVSVPDIPGLVRASDLLKSRPVNVDENGEIVDYASEPAEDAP